MKHAKYVALAATLMSFVAVGTASAQVPQAAAKKPIVAKHETKASLRAEAKIKEADARKTALAEVPGGKVTKHDLEREDGRLIYSYDIKVKGKSGVEEVHVDALTGQVIKHEHEAPKTESAEKKAEGKKKQAKKP